MTTSAETRERPIVLSQREVQAALRSAAVVLRRPIEMDRLRVRLPRAVSADWPLSDRVAKTGAHRATMNPHGAVSALLGATALGLKPGEFHFVCPFADGDTHLGDFGGGRKEWVISARSSRLWVRETWGAVDIRGDGAKTIGDVDQERDEVRYRADQGSQRPGVGGRWFSSTAMPRWASRITLDVVSVRVERLQGITEEDARAAGMDWAAPEPLRVDRRRRHDDDREDPREVGYAPAGSSFALQNFRQVWDETHTGPLTWAANPWVWRIEAKAVRP